MYTFFRQVERVELEVNPEDLHPVELDFLFKLILRFTFLGSAGLQSVLHNAYAHLVVRMQLYADGKCDGNGENHNSINHKRYTFFCIVQLDTKFHFSFSENMHCLGVIKIGTLEIP